MEFHKFLQILSSFSIHTILLCYMNFSVGQSAIPTLRNETDRLDLLAFKGGITHDPFRTLSSWNDSIHFCSWEGVTCSRRHQRVVVLDLRSRGLVGFISPHIGNLTFLRGINLQNNSFHGGIPQEIGRLFRLRQLILRLNSLQGEIPVNLTRCSELTFLDLVANKLVGSIPAELGTISKLYGLGLAINNLTGSIPASLSNLSSLTKFSLSENSLTGNIPTELGQLSRLEFFQISSNKITGKVPAQLFNLSSIAYFGVADNTLHGTLPHDIGLALPNLQVLLLGKNGFSGPMPDSVSNASSLLRLEISSNYFTGPIRVDFGRLQGLTRLNLGRNRLGTGEADDLSFLTSLTNCTYLEVLGLNENSLGGKLPTTIANLSSKLQYFYIGANQIFGSIPTGIENLVSLYSLGMEKNLLTGGIPVSVGKLPQLQVLSLFGSKFSGTIPSSLGNLTSLIELNLKENELQGSIPQSLGSFRYLQTLDLSGNKLTGAIPKQVIGLSSLSVYLDLAQNSLAGSLPLDMGNLKNIREFDVSDNKLSGRIPSTIENCVSLEGLYLQGNSFQGPIPPSLSALKGVTDIDLSRNNFSGKIPEYLGKLLFLNHLNLSFNDLQGKLPDQGIFENISAISVIGNSKLCGGVPELHLPACTTGSGKPRWHLLLEIVVPITASVALICVAFVLRWSRKTRKKPSITSPLDDMHLKLSYDDLLRATSGFSSANLIGLGSYGSVYKGTLDHDGSVVAVKVIDLRRRGASKSFMAECDALRNIRHRNLIKILTACSSVDHKGNDFKALIFEFMSNGSLEKWLHPKDEERHQPGCLNLMQRLSIAIDVAQALDYLHHHCHSPIIHCDLKPSNVLLDDDMSVHVGDFGLARFLSDTSQNQTSSLGIRGSVGYVAPEYGMGGEASKAGDVYSYGILLLEMFTGRSPTDDMFSGSLSLHSYSKMALPDQVMEIVDPILHKEMELGEDPSDSKFYNSKKHESLVSIVRIGVLCSKESLRERMEIRDVITELQEIRDAFMRAEDMGRSSNRDPSVSRLRTP